MSGSFWIAFLSNGLLILDSYAILAEDGILPNEQRLMFIWGQSGLS